MTEQHTQPVDNSETSSAVAVATAGTSADDQALASELDRPVTSVATDDLVEELAESDDAITDDGEPASELPDEGVDEPEDEDAEGIERGPDPEALPALIEALLFVADQPIEANALARALEVTPLRARRALDQLAESLRDEARGVRLQVGPDGAQLVTAPETAGAVEHFLGLEASRRLSNAALETLAIIAYRQPVTRHVIDQIRGVDSGGALATLRARNLIEAVGRTPGPGRPVLFGTTQRFLEHFGLERAQDLPALPDDVELPPEEGGAQLALDQAMSAESDDDAADTVEPASTAPAALNSDATETIDDALEGDDLEETAFDVDDNDVEISSDLGELSRAAGAAFGANEEPGSPGN
jgi:segregation and condensation protein B